MTLELGVWSIRGALVVLWACEDEHWGLYCRYGRAVDT